MTGDPETKLARLLDALTAELTAAAAPDVRDSCAKTGRSVASVAAGVRTAMFAPRDPIGDSTSFPRIEGGFVGPYCSRGEDE